MIRIEDLDQSHDWDPDVENAAPAPHDSGYMCRVCKAYVCKFCSPADNEDRDLAVQPCIGEPWWEAS